MADNMDLDAAMADLDIPTSTSTTSAKSISFKPSRFQPKPKGANAKTAAATAKPTIKPKAEPKDPIPTPPVPSSSSSSSSPMNDNPKVEPDTNPKVEARAEEEEEEDEVAREIDVFLTPSPPADENETQIYIMQYPLRPKWQTYQMEKTCTEVRMMPKCKHMEIDLRMDDDPQTFDADLARQLGKDKQTLRSLMGSSATDYAVGILRNNQIHLNPINEIVQMRPVIRPNQQKRKHPTQQVDPESSSSNKMAKTELEDSAQPEDSAQIEDGDESWVPLKFLPEGCILSYEYQKKMVTTKHMKVEFRMTQGDYMRALCPGESVSRRETKEAIIREVKKLPLEERLKKYFTEVEQLNRFDFIEHLLAPDYSVEEVLKQVQILADLVRGVWVTKTSLLYEGDKATVRDYILLQFTKANSIPCEQLRSNLGRDVLGNEALRGLLGNLIISKTKEDKVKFKGSPDPTFRKRFNDVVKGQMEAWSAREESIMERVGELPKSGVSRIKRVVVLKDDKEKKMAENSPRHADDGPAISASKLISENKKHLQEALTKIFDDQKVRTIRSVVRDLREMAKRLSALPKSSDKHKHLIDGALCGVSATPAELLDVVKRIAVHIYGVFVMKPPKKEHLRNVFILLFMDAKKPKAVLRKQDIMQRGKEIFRRDISESEYAQVVDDICITTEDGGLMLKDGD